jgi:hypothetical protein
MTRRLPQRGSVRGGAGAVRTRMRRRRLWPTRATWRRWLRRLRRAPVAVRAALVLLLLAALALGVNALYQVVRKPTELFFPVSGTLYKTPHETWRQYAPLFRRYATRTITPELLAALAQVEASGNPLVRTYWRWSWVPRPFELYRPASSAVGMYQITDGTFAEARHYCIHDHRLVHEGRWDEWNSCWFTRLYSRIVPADAVELTAAYLDLKVNQILAEAAGAPATATQQRHLAAVVHLCGAAAAATFVHQGWRFGAAQRCGDHEPRAYLQRVDAMHSAFARLAAEEEADAPTPQ